MLLVIASTSCIMISGRVTTVVNVEILRSRVSGVLCVSCANVYTVLMKHHSKPNGMKEMASATAVV